MNLKLSVENKVLASVPVAPFASDNEYYLKAFRRLLVLRHHGKLKASKQAPHFSLEQTDKRKA